MSSPYIEAGLSPEATDVHRALASLQEELEAIDYYHQRWDRSKDESLQAILAHNRDDEMEHAMLLLEWLRRALPSMDEQMRKLLFTKGSITQATQATQGASPDPGCGLGLGRLNNPIAQEDRP